MVKDRDKTSEPGEVGTELDLPDEGDFSQPASPLSNMSFGMVDLGGDEPAADKLPPPEEVSKPPEPEPEPEPKPQAPPKPPPKVDSAKPAVPPPAPPSQSAATPYAIGRRQRSMSPSGLPMARSARMREEVPQTAEIRVAGFSRTVKIALIVILALVVIALGVFLYLKWQKSVEKEHQAELERLNQQSRDSLMDDRFKKE